MDYILSQFFIGVKSNMEKIGSKLHALRNQRGYTLRKLAEILGVHYTHLNKIENGQKKPSTELILKISGQFNVTTDQLMKDDLSID